MKQASRLQPAFYIAAASAMGMFLLSVFGRRVCTTERDTEHYSTDTDETGPVAPDATVTITTMQRRAGHNGCQRGQKVDQLSVIMVFLAMVAFTTVLAAMESLDGAGRLNMHIDCRGKGRPAVIFESGLAASALSWTFVQPEIAKLVRTCSYDRAGLGFSPRNPARRTLANITSELRDVLRAASLEPPYVLVGHSYGGLIIRHFADCCRSDIAGMVFVDPVCVSQWCEAPQERRQLLARGVMLARRGAWLARLGLVHVGLALLTSGQRRIPRLIATAASGRASNVVARLAGEVSKLPQDVWPVLKRQWSQPKCFAAMAEYLECLPENAAAISAASGFGELPVVVISSGAATDTELEEHKALAALSSRGRHVVAQHSGHWVPFDRPDVVVESVNWVLIQLHGCG